MRLIFAGTPDTALPLLEAVAALEDHEIVGVLTRPDAPRGRSKKLRPSQIAKRAEELSIPVYKPATLKDEAAHQLLDSLHADLAVVVAYGQIIPPPALAQLPKGWINVHYSLLPKWRGAAPVERAIEAEERETGVSIFQIEEGLDTGPIWDKQEVPISPSTDTPQLFEALNVKAAQMIGHVLAKIADGNEAPLPQEGTSSYAKMFNKAAQQVDWQRPAEEVSAKIRAFTPGAWSTHQGTRMKIASPTITAKTLPAGAIQATKKQLFVGTGTEALEIGQVAPAGKSWMSGAAWARGAHLDASSKMEEK